MLLSVYSPLHFPEDRLTDVCLLSNEDLLNLFCGSQATKDITAGPFLKDIYANIIARFKEIYLFREITGSILLMGNV